MPLEKGSSKKVVGENIAEMEKAGHPPKQAIAASLENAGLSNKHAEQEHAPAGTPQGGQFVKGSAKSSGKSAPVGLEMGKRNLDDYEGAYQHEPDTQGHDMVASNPAYAKAHADYKKVSAEHTEMTKKYRAGKASDKEFLDSKARFKKAQDDFDKAEAAAVGDKHAEKSGLANVKDVEIFSTGDHRGKRYTHADLDDMVENFKKFSTGDNAPVKPPVVIGHEEEQQLLENSGIPRMGEPDKLWQEKIKCRLCNGKGIDPQADTQCPICLGTGKQGVLMTNFRNVPASIARLINARAYDVVSSEVYPQPPAGVPGTGKMLRRIALLGGQLPQIKVLADLPWADYEGYSENDKFQKLLLPVAIRLSSVKVIEDGCHVCFSEIVKMADTAHVPAGSPQGGQFAKRTAGDTHKTLKKAGIDASVGQKGEEHHIRVNEGDAGRVVHHLSQHGKTTAISPNTVVHTPHKFGEGETMDRNAMCQKLAEHGMDPEVMKAMPDEHLAAVLKSHEGKKDAMDVNDKPSVPMYDEHETPHEDIKDVGGWEKVPKGEGLVKFREHMRKKFGEMAKKYNEYGSKHFGEDYDKAPEAGKLKTMVDPWDNDSDRAPFPNKGMAPSGPEGQGLPLMHKELDAIVDQVIMKLRGEMAPIKADVERFKEETHRETVTAFVASRRAQGKISSRELDRPNGRPNIEDRLMATDRTAVVHKFSEKGQEKRMTALDLAMAEIDARQPIKYSERIVTDPKTPNGKPQADLSEVERFCEQHEEELAKVGFTKEEFVGAYKNAKPEDRAELMRIAG